MKMKWMRLWGLVFAVSAFGCPARGGIGMLGDDEVDMEIRGATTEKVLFVDDDADGLPDEWEVLYYGDLSKMPNDLCANGVNTLREAYLLGANPTDASLTTETAKCFFVDYGEDYVWYHNDQYLFRGEWSDGEDTMQFVYDQDLNGDSVSNDSIP